MVGQSTLVVLLASALAPVVSATRYAQFCNDNACKVGCGASVSVTNPGCLNESGRNSIKFHDVNDGAPDISLVFSPKPNCPCQNECLTKSDFSGGEKKCFDLNGNKGAQSFRFISGDCGKNNC